MRDLFLAVQGACPVTVRNRLTDKLFTMKKTLLYIYIAALLFTGSVAVSAQDSDGFQISARTSGVADTTVYLIGTDVDTLCATRMNHGNFFFKGKVDKPSVAYIRMANGVGAIPVMLENTNFQMLASAQGVSVVGGDYQKIYNDYMALNNNTRAEQQKVQKEMQEAAQEGNQMKMQGIQNGFAAYVEKARKQEVELWNQCAKSFVGTYLLVTNMNDMPATMVRSRYEQLPAEERESGLGKAISEYLDKAERIMVGKTAPDFTLPTMEGDSISMHALKGKVKIIDFWASWCAPCRREMPTLVRLYKQYQTKGLEILSVSIDDKKDKWKNAIFEDGNTWKNVSDLKGAKSPVVALYGFKSIPFMVVVDENNKIVAVNLRGKALEEKVAELMK